MKARSPFFLAMVWLAIGWTAACGRERVDLSAEPADPVEIEASVDRAVATTGDLITYSIRVDYAPDYEIDIPEAGAEIAGFRITDTRSEGSELRSGRRLEERTYELRADLVGSYVLPPITVLYRQRSDGESEPSTDWQSATTSEIFVEVESVLPSTEDATDIRGLKPIERRPNQIPWMWIGVGGLVILAGSLLAWWMLRRRSAAVEAAIPPHERAFARLDALRATDFGDRQAVRRFCFAISEIVREYVEGRFGLNATDLTTEEIIDDLPSIAELSAPHQQELIHFLRSTDQVKFAGSDPDPSGIERIYESALSFVEATRPMIEADGGESETLVADEEIAA